MGPVLKSLVVVVAGTLAVPALAAIWDLGIGPPASLPALSRYEAPVFPEKLRLTSVTDGYATMIFTVKADGRVEDALALEASDPAFVDATLRALLQWRLAAASSTTVPRREIIQFDYKRTGTIASLSQREASKAAFGAGEAQIRPIRTLTWEQLDDQPQRISGVMPAYPAALRSNPVRGHAMVSFVIDTQGRVRVATVADSSAPQFGEAALAAVSQWRFEPTRLQGSAVNVQVIRSFSFGGTQQRGEAGHETQTAANDRGS